MRKDKKGARRDEPLTREAFRKRKEQEKWQATLQRALGWQPRTSDNKQRPSVSPVSRTTRVFSLHEPTVEVPSQQRTHETEAQPEEHDFWQIHKDGRLDAFLNWGIVLALLGIVIATVIALYL